jgi:hypothetical protein
MNFLSCNRIRQELRLLFAIALLLYRSNHISHPIILASMKESQEINDESISQISKIARYIHISTYIHDDTVHLLEVTSTSTAVRVLTKRKRLIMSPKIDFFVYFPESTSPNSRAPSRLVCPYSMHGMCWRHYV